MPVIDTNIYAVLLATAVAMVTGYVWYSPQVMGKTWQKLVGLSDKDVKGSGQVTPMVAMLVLVFVEMFVLSHFINYVRFFYVDHTVNAVGLLTALWVWVGFVFPVMAGSYMFAQRRKKLLAIDSGYHLVVLVIAGLILANIM